MMATGRFSVREIQAARVQEDTNQLSRTSVPKFLRPLGPGQQQRLMFNQHMRLRMQGQGALEV